MSDRAATDDAATDEAATDGTLDRLTAAPAVTDGLRGRLAREAQAEGVVDVGYREVDSPIGELLLAATPRGLVYTAFAVEQSGEVLDMLAKRIGPRVLWMPGPGVPGVPGAAVSGDGCSAVLDRAAGQLGEYLEGRRRGFDVPLDTALATGFRGEVQQHLASVDYGRTATYKELATELGRPGAVRAVGTACATNPLPLVWPCHRVLRSDGGLGGYRGGLDAKRRLLEMEAVA